MPYRGKIPRNKQHHIVNIQNVSIGLAGILELNPATKFHQITNEYLRVAECMEICSHKINWCSRME